MNSIYLAIGITISLFVFLLIINKGKKTIDIVTNIGIAVIAGVIVIVAGNISDSIETESTINPTTTVATVAAVVATTATPIPIPNITSTPHNEISVSFDSQGFVNNYLSDMANAINSNDFSKVEKYLKADSVAYIEQKDYIINYCKKNNIKEYFKSVEILKTNMVNKYTAVLDTYETYDITSPSRGNRTSSFNTQYTIEYTEGDWKISKIVNQ